LTRRQDPHETTRWKFFDDLIGYAFRSFRSCHRYPVQRGEKQLTFWVKIENATPENMKLSLQGRRNGARDDVLQAERDRRYFNVHYNPGDPIKISWNVDLDVAEREFPPDDTDESPKKPNAK